MPKSIGSLNLGFSDAQNYIQRNNKQILSEVFVKNAYLTKLLQPNVYYLIGEKGTGKTDDQRFQTLASQIPLYRFQI